MKRGLLLICVLVSVAGVAGLQAQQPAYDIVIHGGMIVDGSGNHAEWGVGDVTGSSETPTISSSLDIEGI
ncbi:hypothetical protein MYX82_13520 [Acidobacteria bacterium AH-259-D05]|nr:hypothetical protein [Acidobacteria bacterium AH-259-D05]